MIVCLISLVLQSIVKWLNGESTCVFLVIFPIIYIQIVKRVKFKNLTENGTGQTS